MSVEVSQSYGGGEGVGGLNVTLRRSEARVGGGRGEGGGERGILGNELAQLLAARGTRLLGLGRAGGEEGREISRKSERSGGFRVPNGV